MPRVTEVVDRPSASGPREFSPPTWHQAGRVERFLYAFQREQVLVEMSSCSRLADNMAAFILLFPSSLDQRNEFDPLVGKLQHMGETAGHLERNIRANVFPANWKGFLGSCMTLKSMTAELLKSGTSALLGNQLSPIEQGVRRNEYRAMKQLARAC